MSEQPYERNQDFQDMGILNDDAVPTPSTSEQDKDQLETEHADRVDTAVMPDSSREVSD